MMLASKWTAGVKCVCACVLLFSRLAALWCCEHYSQAWQDSLATWYDDHTRASTRIVTLLSD